MRISPTAFQAPRFGIALARPKQSAALPAPNPPSVTAQAEASMADTLFQMMKQAMVEVDSGQPNTTPQTAEDLLADQFHNSLEPLNRVPYRGARKVSPVGSSQGETYEFNAGSSSYKVSNLKIQGGQTTWSLTGYPNGRKSKKHAFADDHYLVEVLKMPQGRVVRYHPENGDGIITSRDEIVFNTYESSLSTILNRARDASKNQN